jgi:tRNA/tmRNA/rRNA uracil-C5-methylase (TrmA/RlmC/RlmD family)
LEQLSDEEAPVPAGKDRERAGDTPATTLIVDPPATGLSASLRETIADLAPATVIYVSCNPATLARDLADLSTRFKIESVTPLDMFPQTAEIEAVAHLQPLNDSTN